MRLPGMVDALKAQELDPGSRELSFLERLGLLVAAGPVEREPEMERDQSAVRMLGRQRLQAPDGVRRPGGERGPHLGVE